MTKKYHTRRHLKGGFLDSIGQTFSNLGTSISQGASSIWKETKKASGLDNTSSSASTYTPSTYTPSTSSTTSTAPISSTYSYGGKRARKGTRKIKRSKTMKRGGNFSANTPINTLASRAGDFTGGLTARAHDLVGGKRRRSSKMSRGSKRLRR
jgi:hypothetical protein